MTEVQKTDAVDKQHESALSLGDLQFSEIEAEVFSEINEITSEGAEFASGGGPCGGCCSCGGGC